MENMKTIALTNDEVSYLMELLNNERYTSNNNATLAESLITVLHDTQSLSDDDLFAQLSDEEIDARIAYASRLEVAADAGFDTWEDYRGER